MYIVKELIKFDAFERKPREKYWLATDISQSCPSPKLGLTSWTFSVLNSQLSSIVACFNFLKVTSELVLLEVFDFYLICFCCAEALLICLV